MTGWRSIRDEPGSGWLFFAGTVLGLAGLMRIIDALWAFRYKGALPENLKTAYWVRTCTTTHGRGSSSERS